MTPSYAECMHSVLVQQLGTNAPFPSPEGPIATLCAAAFDAALAARRIALPPAAKQHGMRLAHNLAHAATTRPGAAHARQEIVEWMARTHAMDLHILATRIQREAPNATQDALLAQIAHAGAQRLDTGTFAMVPDQSYLVESQWDGHHHQLSMDGWAFCIARTAHAASMRLPSTLRPLAKAPVPGHIEADIVLPTGRLIIGSTCPDRGLDAAMVDMRRTEKGLEGSIATVNTILDTHHAFSLPVHQRSIALLAHKGDIAFVHPTRDARDNLPPHTCADTLLDYRHMVVIDEGVLRENLRTRWDEPDVDVDARLKAALDTCAHSHVRARVPAGRYRATLPANYDHRIPARLMRSKLGHGMPTVLHLHHLAPLR